MLLLTSVNWNPLGFKASFFFKEVTFVWSHPPPPLPHCILDFMVASCICRGFHCEVLVLPGQLECVCMGAVVQDSIEEGLYGFVLHLEICFVGPHGAAALTWIARLS